MKHRHTHDAPCCEIVRPNASPASHPPGYGCRGYQYAKPLASIGSLANKRYSLCGDGGCVMSLIDRFFFTRMAKIEKMPTPMRVRGIGDNTHNASGCALVDFFFSTTNGCIARFQQEMHIIAGLGAHTLIDIDVLHPESLNLVLSKEMAGLTHNRHLKPEIIARSENAKRHIITKTIVPLHLGGLVPLNATRSKAWMYQSVTCYSSHLMRLGLCSLTSSMRKGILLWSQKSGTPVVLPKHTRLDSVVNTEINGFCTTPKSNANPGATGRKPSCKHLTL